MSMRFLPVRYGTTNGHSGFSAFNTADKYGKRAYLRVFELIQKLSDEKPRYRNKNKIYNLFHSDKLLIKKITGCNGRYTPHNFRNYLLR